eukprot:TRINITY_DN1056_c0_g1_i1.p2 TRINITY_DN1056_c0_g1~~TRINITY_DN1056_c0_g1_i1.p2  ORF type:complete len:346 (-),score=128.21 TRINITY_DN1056_c0_g1_i1:68-1105(-)
MSGKQDKKEAVWAPLNVPLHRRRQTFAVLLWALLYPICLGLTIFLLTFPLCWFFAFPYFLYCALDKAQINGGRKKDWFRRLPLWKHFVDYFPVSLEKTVDLDPSKNYVMGYHPHGIISMGAFGNFATEATGFSEKFPGINLRLLTLSMNFKVPFLRDILLNLGVCDVAERSCHNILKKGPGNSIMIVVGGAAEALDAHPKSYDLLLGRSGFVRVALMNGASLVPVLSFGENDLYEQVENPRGSKLRRLQRWMQQKVGFSIPLFYGRGIFNYRIGLLPRRVAINTVVGTPIDCPKIENPSKEQIAEYHHKYVEGVRDIWNSRKNKYALDRKATLRIYQSADSDKTE